MKVLFYPHYLNPYQAILKKEIESLPEIKSVKFLETNHKAFVYFITPLILYRISGFAVFHLHWPDFSLHTLGKLSLFASLLNTLIIVSTIKLLGFKLIWTIHNIAPHERQTSNDLLVTKFLCWIADALIIHSDNTRDDLYRVGIFKINPFLVRLGNYNSLYENLTLKSVCREKLNIKDDEFVFLFFGLIRRYKNIENLLSSFKKATKWMKNGKLVIVGECKDQAYREEIESMISSHSVVFYSKYIPDSDLQLYFNACDIAVFPFTKITTTSSTYVAFSFKKPIIAPRIGSILEYPEDTGIYYDPLTENALSNALIRAYKNRRSLVSLGKNGYSYTQQFTWQSVAKRTVAVYKGQSSNWKQ